MQMRPRCASTASLHTHAYQLYLFAIHVPPLCSFNIDSQNALPRQTNMFVRFANLSSNTTQHETSDTIGQTQTNQHKPTHTHPACCQAYLHVRCRQCPTSTTQTRMSARFQRTKTLPTLHHQIIADPPLPSRFWRLPSRYRIKMVSW